MDKLVLAHGIVLTVCWCLFADIALFVVTLRYKWWAAWVHAIIMTAVVATTYALALVVVHNKGGIG